MIISFSPQGRTERLVASLSGEILTLNGEAFDFSDIPDGATLPKSAVICDWLASDIERIAGEIHLTLILPHGANAPEETRFPQPIVATAGTVVLPLYEAPAPAPETIPETEEVV